MRLIRADKIKNVISGLCIKANTILRKDVMSALKKAAASERNSKAKKVLAVLVENAAIARREKLAICQDTGMACVYLEIGRNVKIAGGDLEKAVTDGVRAGYKKGYFRNSVVDPLTRKNTGTNTPAVVHTRVTPGSKVRITVVPKGFGCENRNMVKMFKPTASIIEIKKFIVDAVKAADADACPPYIIGVGIGGTFEKAAGLSTEALLHKAQSPKPKAQSRIAKLEQEILIEINKLRIGPAGMGGGITALAVTVLIYPTHIAGMPVAVSIGCHAMRAATAVI